MPAWERTHDTRFHQGDVVLGCDVLIPGPEYGVADVEVDTQRVIFDLIVVTNTCDLVNPPPPSFVACCPIFSLDAWRQVNSVLASNTKLNEISSGRLEGVFLLPSEERPEDPWSCFIADFREVYSLPFDYLARKGAESGSRLRLVSPHLEDFSQAFALHFMRVALPDGRPKFKGDPPGRVG